MVDRVLNAVANVAGNVKPDDAAVPIGVRQLPEPLLRKSGVGFRFLRVLVNALANPLVTVIRLMSGFAEGKIPESKPRANSITQDANKPAFNVHHAADLDMANQRREGNAAHTAVNRDLNRFPGAGGIIFDDSFDELEPLSPKQGGKRRKPNREIT